jgi:ABC-type nickel/cobalt efflux system permease component RcnA
MDTLLLELSQILSYFNSEISSLFRELKQEESLSTILLIFAFSIIYGVLHALGPGHGKLLVASYMVNREYSYKKAFKLGYLISTVHAFSALSITLVIYFILEGTITKGFQEATQITTQISGVLIILVALYLFYENFHTHAEEKLDNSKTDFGIAFSAGVVPCPGVMTITMFSIIVSQVSVGVISAILMSLGMGFTISIAGILASKVRKESVSKKQNIGKYLSLIGASGILLLGIFLIFK